MFNANNYGYNPYGTYMPQRPMQQQVQQPIQQPQQVISMNQNNFYVKQVDSVDVVKTIEYPLDGSVSYFPLTDGSAIVTKQMQMDGKSKIVVFRPDIEEKDEVKYITQKDLEKSLNGLKNDDLDDIKEEIKEIKNQLKELRKNKKKDDE